MQSFFLPCARGKFAFGGEVIMRKYYTITILVIITLLAISFYFINNTNKELFYKTQNALLEKVEIIKTSSPSIPRTTPSGQVEPNDITEEYHLWLKIEMTKNSFEQLIPVTTNISNTNESISNTFQNVLVVRGFWEEDNILSNQNGTNSNNFGLPLLFSKSITFSPDSVRQLTDDKNLSKPRIGFDQIDYQTQIYVKSGDIKNLVVLYIHLESNIKPKQITRTISLTLTHFKDNTAIASKTLPLFRY